MNQIFAKVGFVLLALAVPAMGSAQTVLTGQWKNPKGSVIVRLTRCGKAICGFVVNATDEAKETARKGGTPTLIGTRILSDLRPAGDGSFSGKAFDPKRNIRALATVKLVSRDALEIRGCAILGLVCKEQRWTRIG